MVDDRARSAISTGTEFGLGTLLLRYSRDFEKQADLLGAQIMARAGYDPRNLARMFETIEKTSGGGGSPQWMSSHPNPGNRTTYITKEAQALTIGSPPDRSRFEPARARFASLPPAASMADVERRAPSASETTTATGTPGRPVPAPSAKFRDFIGGNVF